MNDKTHGEHNRSAFGCIATVEPDSRASAGNPRSRLKSGSMLLANRGHDADWIRERVIKNGLGQLLPKSNRSDPICFSSYLDRARNQSSGSSTGSNHVVG
ncbi:hypothetical protein BRADO6355 [Bradyrhizobium sp. ORS 278]|nr:hypothetical protein BRADO6355 [Bradyrhizobium sp. ORS 278]